MIVTFRAVVGVRGLKVSTPYFFVKCYPPAIKKNGTSLDFYKSEENFPK
jgi:hypothetical protein